MPGASLDFKTCPCHFRMEDESDARKAKDFEMDFWLSLLNDSFLNSPRVLLKGVPSLDLNNRLIAEEEERVQAQVEKLGPEGLRLAGEKVKRAIDSQTLPPNSVLQSVPVASVDSVAWRKLRHYNHTSDVGLLNLAGF